MSSYSTPGYGTRELNPFVHKLDAFSTIDYFKFAFMTIFVLPIRVLFIILSVLTAYVLASIGLYGFTKENLCEKPFSGWRRVIRWSMGFLGRFMMRCYAFLFVKIKGKLASRNEAPILVVGPHSTFLDCIVVFWSGVPTLVSRIENTHVPFFGKFINFTQPVYVWREDSNSRQNTISEIQGRANSELQWPQVMIFPEGTCTNRSCLITFKSGAFYPGVPVQPVVIRYPNKLDCLTWTWDGPGAFKLLWLTLCQFRNFCEVEYLPVYHPSPEEMKDPSLYASNVRSVMAKALGIPVVDYTYDDCRVMDKALKKHLPCSVGLVEFQKLRRRFGLRLCDVEDTLLAEFASVADDKGRLRIKDFCDYFKWTPYDSPNVVSLFNSFKEQSSESMTFRQFIVLRCEILAFLGCDRVVQLVFDRLQTGNEGRLPIGEFISSVKSTIGFADETEFQLKTEMESLKMDFITLENLPVMCAGRSLVAFLLYMCWKAMGKIGQISEGEMTNVGKILSLRSQVESSSHGDDVSLTKFKGD